MAITPVPTMTPSINRRFMCFLPEAKASVDPRSIRLYLYFVYSTLSVLYETSTRECFVKQAPLVRLCQIVLVRAHLARTTVPAGGKHLGPSRHFRQPEKRRCARRLAAGAAVLLTRDIAPINECRLGQRLGPCDLVADGRAGLGFTPFFWHRWRADSKRRAARDAPRRGVGE